LHEELVHALVAARENDVIELDGLDIVDGVVDRRMHDLEFAGGKTLPLGGRPFREFKVEPQSAPGKNPFGNAGMERQRLGIRERVDSERRLLGSGS
jgi:hypothetical protein